MIRRSHLLATLATLTALAALPSFAQAAPVWEIDSHHQPANFQPGEPAVYSFDLSNVGDESTSGPATVTVKLPEGVKTRVVPGSAFTQPSSILPSPHWLWNDWWNGETACPGGAGETVVSCTFTGGDVPPGAGLLAPGRLDVFVEVEPGAVGPLTAEATVSGGAGEVSVTETAPLGGPGPAFGITPGSFEADAFDRDGQPERQAGSHPYRAIARFDLNQENVMHPSRYDGVIRPWLMPTGNLRDLDAMLPRGFAGNPGALARCTAAQLADVYEVGTQCPTASQVGVIDFAIRNIGGAGLAPTASHVPVYNMVPPKGALADFAFQALGREIHLVASLDPRDYSVVTKVSSLTTEFATFHQTLTLWGVPADPAHDGDRWNPEAKNWGASFAGEPRPFLNLPTECNVPDSTVLTRVTSWLSPETNVGPYSSDPIAVNGCDRVDFVPRVEIRPTTNVAEAPSGLEFNLHIPQNEDPEGLATAHLSDAVVRLPQGMTVNPPSADGLGSCSLEQLNITADGVSTTTTGKHGTVIGTPANCPEDSKVGSVEAISPAIDHPLKGSVYLAEQNRNPFNSLIALYLVIEDSETGVLVKLPGKVEPDQSTGQLTATFRNNPQLPVEDLRLKFKEGPRAPLKTPSTCGTHTAAATFTPWSAPEAPSVSRPSSFELSQGPGGGACVNGGAGAPNSPSFAAGTQDPTAKAFSPFVLKLSRSDGSQQIKAIDTTLPKGLLAKLAGTTYCSDSALASAAGKSGKDEKASASCPGSSHVGVVNVGAGAGSTPLYVQGQAYLAGPYRGAPLSLAIVTPAVAGPFDLGTVVVRSALQVDPETAQVRALSDELPQILQGIPLNIRSVALKMDRPGFTLNPTSCDPMSITGSATSVFNQGASLSNPFQVGECRGLGFKPRLSIRLRGGTKRSQHPALTAVVRARPGDANIAKTVVALPHSEFLAQDHIRTICTRVQYAADQCPKGSIYGSATATTPLLDEVLSGNVYLRSSPNLLPDMVIALRGKIDIDLVGRIDSDKRGGIRTSFDTVPDAPVSRFTLKMAGGKKSLLENSRNLCRSVSRATVRMDGQNGKRHESRPALKSAGCKKKKKGKR